MSVARIHDDEEFVSTRFANLSRHRGLLTRVRTGLVTPAFEGEERR
ncbi:hypothetical protein HMPREF9601_01582 [Cutibacterium acnes HL030PA1]|nr:hypothetical protein HMPREF9601_01582 [Cutibacterium acnes HL030PA1]